MIIDVIEMDVFEHVAESGKASDLYDAFFWEVSEEGDLYWRMRANSGGFLTPEVLSKVREMYEIAETCVHQVDVHFRNNPHEYRQFINSLNGHVAIIDQCPHFSDERSAIAFKLRFG